MTWPARLGGWAALVFALAALNYGSRIAGGRPPKDLLYRWDAAVGGLIQYAFILAIVVFLSRGEGHRELLGLRAPQTSHGRTVLLAIGVMVLVYATAAVLEPYLHAGREQGLTPPDWDSSRAAPFVANFLVIAGLAPLVEELTFRGLGYGVLERFGSTLAIVVVGVSFGLVHGLVYGLPILVVFGVGLAWLRARTRSLYPCVVLHAAFNAVALIGAVAT